MKFYAVQLIDAVRHLHKNGIAHRDLKLENILINKEGYLKIIDFGISKKFEKGKNTKTICGTVEYMAPEITKKKGYGMAVDWWAVGIIIYQLAFGANPFNLSRKKLSPEEFKKNTETLDVVFPDHKEHEYTESLKTLISKLLIKEPDNRLNCDKVGIENDPWFKDIIWN